MHPKQSFKPAVIFHRGEQTCGRKTLPACSGLPKCDDARHLPGPSLPPLLSSPPVTARLCHSSPGAHSGRCLCVLNPATRPLVGMSRPAAVLVRASLPSRNQVSKNPTSCRTLSRTDELSPIYWHKSHLVVF